MAPTSLLVPPKPARRRRPALTLLVLFGCALAGLLSSASFLLALFVPSSSASKLFFPWRPTAAGREPTFSWQQQQVTARAPTTDWTDPQLVDDPAERALARACRRLGADKATDRPRSVLASLPFYEALVASGNASLPGAVSASGLLLSPAPTAPGASGPWHPMLGLVQAGEAAYHARLASQSQTLEAARAEYSRRYAGRAPPPQFDVWWAFAEANDVLFPDEHRTTDLLEPFRALDPVERRRRLRKAERVVPGHEGKRQALVRIWNGPEGLDWAPLLECEDGEVEGKSNETAPRMLPPRVQRRPEKVHKRTKAHLALLQPIQHLLPHFRCEALVRVLARSERSLHMPSRHRSITASHRSAVLNPCRPACRPS